MADYFVLRTASSSNPDGYMEIEDWNATAGFQGWRWGTPAEQRPSGQVEIKAVPYEGYAGPPDDFSDMSVPLMSKRLREATEAAGVDNINFHPVVLRNTETGEAYDYFAFNLVGLMEVIDHAQSTIASHDGDFVGDSSITDLVVDEGKSKDLLMFRLKEKFSVILVHRKVKESIERSGITTVKFIPPEDFMAL